MESARALTRSTTWSRCVKQSFFNTRGFISSSKCGELTRYTRRTGWDCPVGGGSWYVGAARNMEGANDLTRAMHTWGEQLWADGYMATLGLRLIFEPPSDSLGGEINPNSPGTLVHGSSARTTAAMLGNPYWRNFLIDCGNYLWQTARPPRAG